MILRFKGFGRKYKNILYYINMSEMLCQFCNNVFLNKNTLEKHQTTAKYCLELQNKNSNEFACNYCQKKFYRNDILSKHKETCKYKDISEYKSKYDQAEINFINLRQSYEELQIKHTNLLNDNELLNQKINETLIENKKLKDQLNGYKNIQENYNDLKLDYKYMINKYTDLVDKNSSTHKENIKSIENITTKALDKAGNKNIYTNKNIYNQLLPLTDQYLKEQSKFLELKHVKGKAESLAYFANEYSFKDRIICTDVARRNFVFRDEKDNIIKDPKGVKITKKFIETNKHILVKLLTEYSLMFYNDNISVENKDKIEIDECLYAVQRGNTPSNVENYEKFQRIFTTCFSKLVYNKNLVKVTQDERKE